MEDHGLQLSGDILALSVGHVMTRKPVTIQETAHLSEVFDLMDRRGIRHLPVMRAGLLVGLVSERNIRDALPSVLTLRDPAARRRSLAATRVDQVWIADPVTTYSRAPVAELIGQMRRLRAGSIPVVDGHDLVGIVTSGDLIGLLNKLLSGQRVGL